MDEDEYFISKENAAEISLLEEKLVKTTPKKDVRNRSRPKRPDYKKFLSGSNHQLPTNQDLEESEEQVSDSKGVKFQKKQGSNFLNIEENDPETIEGNCIFVEEDDLSQPGVSLFDMLTYKVEIL